MESQGGKITHFGFLSASLSNSARTNVCSQFCVGCAVAALYFFVSHIDQRVRKHYIAFPLQEVLLKYLIVGLFALSSQADHNLEFKLNSLNGATFKLTNQKLSFTGVLREQNSSPLFGNYVLDYTPSPGTGNRPFQCQLTLAKIEIGGGIKGLSGLCKFKDNSQSNPTVCSYDLDAEDGKLVGSNTCNYYSYNVEISLR